MKVLLSWLRELAPLDDDPVALGHTMSALGMAVESLEQLGRGLDGIVVARVLETRAIPGANRVHVVEVDAGDGEALQIVCGAFNMETGDLVPLATVGTTMPNGIAIGRRKLAGEWSNGMLCSSPELGLGGDPGGILILPETLAPGTPLTEALGIESDVLYDLEINPNRPDAMSVAGVARDLAGHYGVPFTLPSPAVEDADPPGAAELATVEVLDGDLCGRFVARVLTGVTVGPSPARIASRLTLLGMRPINNVVDASNYVMLELGQPNHPYDLARLAGRGLRIRRARDGETMVTLDDVERRFTADDLLICDAEDTPVGIAGIMGGASSEISPDTTDVLLELAWFQAMPIAVTARRLGLRTEASARFERGCDPYMLDLAAARFCELLGVAPAPGTIDVRGELPAPAPVRLRTARVNRILGTSLDAATIERCLSPIGFEVTPVDGDHDVVVPSFRPDTESEIDLIEEVARHYGYERIPRTVPPAVHTGALTVRQRERRLVRHAMTGLGLSEAMPMPFLAPGDLARSGLADDGIVLTNPLVAEESVLRTSLLPGLLGAVAYNLSHRNAGVDLWEIGHVFRVPAGPTGSPLPDEREHLAAIVADRDATEAVAIWWALVEVLAVPGAELRAATVAGLHPSRAAEVVVAGEVIGAVGEVDPDVLAAHRIDCRVAWLEIDLGRLLDLPHGERRYRPVSRQPSSDIDLAFEVDDTVPAADVERTLREAAGDLLVRLELFDVFRGAQVREGRRSLAYSLRLQAPDRTLTDEEVGEVRRRVIAAVESAHAANLRS